MGIGACALLAVGGMAAALWSGILWLIACLLDRADGELARLGDLRSESGKVLDFYSDLILDATWFLGAGLGLRHGGLGEAALLLGLLSCASMALSIWYAEMLERLSAPGIKAWNGTQRFHPDDALFLLAPLTWLGWVAPVLVAASVCTPMIAAIMIHRYAGLKRRATESA